MLTRLICRVHVRVSTLAQTILFTKGRGVLNFQDINLLSREVKIHV